MIQIKGLRRVKSQSKILTFITHQLEPLVSIKTSPELESLDEGDLGILAGEASPKA